MYRKNRQHPAW